MFDCWQNNDWKLIPKSPNMSLEICENVLKSASLLPGTAFKKYFPFF